MKLEKKAIYFLQNTLIPTLGSRGFFSFLISNCSRRTATRWLVNPPRYFEKGPHTSSVLRTHEGISRE